MQAQSFAIKATRFSGFFDIVREGCDDEATGFDLGHMNILISKRNPIFTIDVVGGSDILAKHPDRGDRRLSFRKNQRQYIFDRLVFRAFDRGEALVHHLLNCHRDTFNKSQSVSFIRVSPVVHFEYSQSQLFLLIT
jgi:hypothetical protein